jgi:hypothetical protein
MLKLWEEMDLVMLPLEIFFSVKERTDPLSRVIEPVHVKSLVFDFIFV